jgi:hypothetical protein
MIKINDKTLIEIWQETYPKLRPWIAVLLIGALLTSVIFDNTSYKVSILSAFAGNIIFLIFDLTKTLKSRLDKIDSNLQTPIPPFYPNFNNAVEVIKKTITDKLDKNKTVDVKILAVSAQYSWKVLIETIIPPLLKTENIKINIEILIVKPSLLHNWGQIPLENDANNTIIGVENFKKKYKSSFSENKITLELYQYDNLPHWHGILIDKDVLFMGRCKWEQIDGKYHLLVGQIDYRQFKKADRFGGDARLELVDNWIDAYKFRVSKTKNN